MTRRIVIALASAAAFSLATLTTAWAHGDETEVGRPVAFSGRIAPVTELRAPSMEILGDVATYRDGAWRSEVVETSDPRLDGEVTLVANRDL